jgi:hypothetical protein
MPAPPGCPTFQKVTDQLVTARFLRYRSDAVHERSEKPMEHPGMYRFPMTTL